MLELIPVSKHATSDEYFGQYCIRFILGIGESFFWVHNEVKGKKKRCFWPLLRSPLSLSQTLRRDTYTNSRKLQTISMFHHTRALSNISLSNLNVIYPAEWTQSVYTLPPIPGSKNCPAHFPDQRFSTIRKRT